MAATSRDTSTALAGQGSLIDERLDFQNIRKMLDEEPFRVHFFQAVRMLQRMEARSQAGRIFRHTAGGDDPLFVADFAGISAQ